MINKLEICRITKRFGEKTLFEDLNLTLAEPAVLWAPSGWGKTTLLRILMGLEVPDSGTVQGVGRVGAAFQEDRLCPQLMALENVLLTAGRKKEREACDILARLGLGESLAVPAAELSGGMRRRCALARSLCAEFDLLVLDEPFKGLDEANRRAAMDAVRAVSDDKTVLLVTHDAAEAEFFGGNRLSVP